MNLIGSKRRRNEEKITDKTETWERYERGKNYCSGLNLYAQTDKNWRYFQGDQWRGANFGGISKVRYNFIQPIVNYKITIVAQNMMTLSYNPNVFEMLLDDDNEAFMPTAQETCDKLNEHASKLWERLKMDSVLWDCIQDAAVSGDSILYFYYDKTNEEAKMEMVDNTNIYYGDENDKSIQEQPYIIIAFRTTVERAREEARENGIEEDEVIQITSDSDTNEQAGDAAKRELEEGKDDGDGKCIVLLELRKKRNEAGEKTVHCSKSTRNVTIQEWEDTGMANYPIVHMAWNRRKGCIRGYGEVQFLIDNQIEENKTLARRAMAVMQSAYPKIIYDSEAVGDVDKLLETGAAIAVEGDNVNAVNTKIAYLAPASMSNDAHNLSNEIMTVTKDLAGASDAAIGNVDPTKASGNAILAVRDASAAPMSKQVAIFKQFVEDIGRVWFDMWAAYSVNGKAILLEEETETGEITQRIERIPYDVLNRLKVNINVDISPANPYNKWAVEQTLENFLLQNRITFEEYVTALPPDSAAPKWKLQQILEKRKKEQQENEQIQQEQPMIENEEQPMEDTSQDQLDEYMGKTQAQAPESSVPQLIGDEQGIQEPQGQPLSDEERLKQLRQQYSDELTEDEIQELL